MSVSVVSRDRKSVIMYLSGVLLCFIGVSSTTPIALQGRSNSTGNDSQTASVQEISQPPMTVQNASPQDYILPGYFPFNKGEPFYVEKDPLTGAIDFNKKTTPVGGDKVESNTSSGLHDEKLSSSDTDSDYFYEDGDFVEDPIDRKDGSIEGSNAYRPNDILQNPYKISPDLHQFLNLPVHYSSSDKFPLISSSYANTKVQGTGSSSYSSYSNHKYATPSTQSPSYYTMPTNKYSTNKQQHTTTTEATTTSVTTPRPTSSTTTTEPEEEYENGDYNEYEGEDSVLPVDNQALPSDRHTFRPDTTKYTVTTYRPTTFRFTTTSTVRPKTSALPSTEKPKQQVSIVTSLPLDVYLSSTHDPTVLPTSTNAPSHRPTASSPGTPVSSTPYATTNISLNTQQSVETNIYNQNQGHIGQNEGSYSGIGEEPFRPIFGSSDTPSRLDGNNYILPEKNEYLKPKPISTNEFHRLPPHHNIPYTQRPTLIPEMKPPRPDASQSFYPQTPIKPIDLPQNTVNFGDPPKLSLSPVHSHGSIYESPPPHPSFVKEVNPTLYKPQNPLIEQNNPDSHNIYSARPAQNLKPNPTYPDIPNKSNFKMPSKVDNHFIKVSPDQQNPSYSLQTSFSIGVPAQSDKIEVQPGQGVGQVLFPDNTPAENTPPDVNVGQNIPPQVLRPPNNRLPVQSFPSNRPGYRQPIHPQARPSPPYRVPNDDLQPPSEEADNYPRPHWENPSKPFYGPAENSIPKRDIVLPPNYPGLNRVKPENIQRPDLPNILPQFRPNAKLGHVEQPYHQSFNPSSDRMREPFDTLQPPPLPQPQHLRINRNDDELTIEEDIPLPEVKTDPLVHRRSGPQLPRVTTLQMMQQSPQRKGSVHPEFSPENRHSPDKEKPVFLVYPSAHGMKQKTPPEEVVVIGTRAQRPLPPANLEKDNDNLDSFPLDDNKQFPIPGRDRVDTPILKTKLPSKPLVKNEFPYAIVKPNDNIIPEERILSAGSEKEYTAYSPTPSSSTEESKDHDSGINLIPYLQDYMPFATKRPQILLKPSNGVRKDKVPQKPAQISTTLNASLATTTVKPLIEKHTENQKESQDKSGSEMTVSATMFTQQRPENHRVPVTYTPSEPQPLGFQAPFMASLSAPESQGWTVVTDKNLKPVGEKEEETKESESDTKFDIENFKPQLFGGFKPIMPSSEEDTGSISGKDKNKDVVLDKGDREERSL